MTPTPLYVLVWHESPSRRLRTYTAADGRPILSPLKHIFPPPDHVFAESAADLDEWLLHSHPDDTETVAVSENLARTKLGWDPAPPAHSHEQTETSQDGISSS